MIIIRPKIAANKANIKYFQKQLWFEWKQLQKNSKKKFTYGLLRGWFLCLSCFFLTAGTIDYWQAWVYCAVIFVPLFFSVSYFLKKDPKLLERRMKLKEKESKQKTIITIASLVFFIGFLIPGLDHRYGWSNVPLWLVIASDAIVMLGYLVFLLALKENSYASHIIEVEKKQKVTTTGPYSIIRHPMYIGTIILSLFTPIALGSFWALIAFIPLPALLAYRILNEEEVLSRELEGYKEYCQKVKYRLIPFVW